MADCYTLVCNILFIRTMGFSNPTQAPQGPKPLVTLHRELTSQVLRPDDPPDFNHDDLVHVGYDCLPRKTK